MNRKLRHGLPEPKEFSNVSVVLAIKDFSGDFADSIETWLDLGIQELIIVDSSGSRQFGLEPDSLKVKEDSRIRVIRQPPLGLGAARKQGSVACKGELVLHAGPDNLMPAETLSLMIRELSQASLVSCQTILKEQNGYLNKCHQLSKARLSPGTGLEVVGTPYIGRRELFSAFPFNTKMQNSDDTEFCSRLVSSGHIISRVEAPCYEHGFVELSEIKERWTRWGRGDAIFYESQVSVWSWFRKAKSICHPLEAEILQPFRKLRIRQFLYGLPFFVLVCSYRYQGWIKYVKHNKEAVPS